MPPYSLSMVVSSGIGMGVIVGIVSGVCYVVIHGFIEKRDLNSSSNDNCNVCGAKFKFQSTDEIATCTKCDKKVCKSKCSRLNSQICWVCELCYKSEFWLLKQFRSYYFVEADHSKKNMSSIPPEDDSDTKKRSDKEHVRDFIERLVEAMLGHDVDNTSVNHIYSDENYLPIIGQSPCAAHASLKLLIRRIVQEAIGLPKLKKVRDQPATPEDEDANRTYENLLATAILNKVIQNYQEEVSTYTKSNKTFTPSQNNNREYYFGKETLDTKWKNKNSIADIDSTSVSSIEEWIHGEGSSGTSSKHVDPTTLKIRRSIEEVSSSDNDESNTALLSNKDESDEWQNNWLMQKRKLGGTSSPVPVPMLVPNPSTEAKVLIGDREAEDTTDLSDAASELEDDESTPSIEHLLVDSKTIIGGKNLLNSVNVENEVPKNEEKISEKPKTENESSFDSIESRVEKDVEYTEKYATLPRTFLKSLLNEEDQETPLENRNPVQGISENGEVIEHKFEGRYSEREKQKWNNAIEMKNNPYSPENLQRRLVDGSNKFSADPYVKDSTIPTRTIKEVAENKNVMQESLFKAVPAMADDSISFRTDMESSLELSLKPNTLDISSDSDLSVERTYNLDTGRVYEKIGEGIREIIDGSKSPQGIKYLTKNPEFDKLYDENHNSAILHNKKIFEEEPNTTFEPIMQEHETRPEIMSLQDRQLVKNRLGQFSKSHPSLETLPIKKESLKIDASSSIKNLKQLFNHDENLQNKLEQVHSLTARSIPHQLRNKLKFEEDIHLNHEDLLSCIYTEEFKIFPDAKSRIEFFENLNR